MRLFKTKVHFKLLHEYIRIRNFLIELPLIQIQLLGYLIVIHSRKNFISVEVCNSMKTRQDDMQTFNSYYSLSVFLNLCVVTSPQQTRQHFSLVTWATGNPLVNERFTVPIFLGKGHNVLWYGRGCWTQNDKEGEGG